MKSFEEYVKEWFNKYVEEHTSDLYEISKAVRGSKVKKGIGRDKYEAMLVSADVYQVYKTFFGYSAKEVGLDDIPSTSDFWEGILNEYLEECENDTYHDFMKMLVEDIASFMNNYSDPKDFFYDLNHGGCASGMIPLFIYNEDCLSFYRKHANEMEEFREDIEEEVGQSMKFDRGTRHYVSMCWMCYEVFAYRVACALFPDDM